jgi:hypothetical protein
MDNIFNLSGHSNGGGGGGGGVVGVGVVGVGVVGVGVVGVGFGVVGVVGVGVVGVGSSSPPQAVNETSDTIITRANKTNNIVLLMGFTS